MNTLVQHKLAEPDELLLYNSFEKMHNEASIVKSIHIPACVSQTLDTFWNSTRGHAGTQE